MTNPDYTAIALLVDRSGSMRGIHKDAEGGIATLVADQQALPGKCTLRISQFDDTYETVHHSLPIADVPAYTLTPRGMTALMDSWGKLMTEFGEELAALPEDERPANVIFVVVTDGYENASSEWTREQVMAMVKRQTDEWNWEFLYLAANQDAVAEGAKFGVGGNNTYTYDATSVGTRQAYASASASIVGTRTGVAAPLNPEGNK